MHRKLAGLLVVLPLTTGCADPITSMSYDGTFSSGAGDGLDLGNDDGWPTIDTCYLSGEGFSVFVSELANAPTSQGPTCPDPKYYDSWGDADATLVDTAAGKSPDEDHKLIFFSAVAIPWTQMQTGQKLLIAARFHEATNAWIVGESVGVSMGDDTTAITDSGGRTIDLPTSWTLLTAGLKNDRKRDCGRKALWGTFDDARFLSEVMEGRQEAWDRQCSGWVPEEEPVPVDDGYDGP